MNSARLAPDDIPYESEIRPTVLRAGLHFEGSMQTSGDVLIEGSVRGDLVARSITVAQGAKVFGNVKAAMLTISGTVDGTVRCANILVNPEGTLAGDIHQSILVVLPCGTINGNLFKINTQS